jgi:hypothetical protein
MKILFILLCLIHTSCTRVQPAPTTITGVERVFSPPPIQIVIAHIITDKNGDRYLVNRDGGTPVKLSHDPLR